jgi:hypothetical protein
MKRPASLLLLLGLALAPATLAGQQSPPLVRYGKWVLAAGAVGLNLLAARDHGHADDAFDELRSFCFDNFDRCAVGPDGRYLNRRSEGLYQTSLHYDRRARTWLVGGEAALVAAAGMFVWELTRRTDKPDNIPFEPEVRSLERATGIGVRVAW